MTYVYRDPARMARFPVHVPAPPQPEPDPPAPPVTPPKPPLARPSPSAPAKTLQALPPPIWGGRLGLELAAAESADLDRRTEALIKAGASTDWVREYKRIRQSTSNRRHTP